MADLMSEAGLPAPENRTEGFFTTVLYKNTPTSSQNVGENVGENHQTSPKGKEKRVQAILALMRANPQISSVELAKSLNVTARTIERDIAWMRETKKIARQGSDKGGEWVIL